MTTPGFGSGLVILHTLEDRGPMTMAKIIEAVQEQRHDFVTNAIRHYVGIYERMGSIARVGRKYKYVPYQARRAAK